MLENYFKTAFRFLRNHPLTSVLNLLGLSVALCACFFAILYVRFELGYDTFHEKSDRIYRLVTDVKSSEGISYESSTGAMGPALKENFPEVKEMTRIFLDYLIVQKDADTYAEEKIAYTDASFFSVFSFPLLQGDPEKVLNTAQTVVMSESLAEKYFDQQNPIGQSIYFNGDQDTPYLVTGIMEDMPQNSHIRADLLVSMASLGESWMQNWKRFFFYTYLVLPEQPELEKLAEKFTQHIQPHIKPDQGEFVMHLEPLEKIYLYAKARASRTGSASTGNINHVYIISCAALLVLLIASINFINLSSAQAFQREGEMHIRKAIGATQKQLLWQLLTESCMLGGIAFALSMCFGWFLMPYFNDLTGKPIILDLMAQSVEIGLISITALLISLLAGLYPAFLISVPRFMDQFSTGKQLHFSGQNNLLAKISLISQFSISLILMIATLVVYLQVGFMQNHKLGFDNSQQLVLDFQFDDQVIEKRALLRQELGKIQGVQQVSFSSSIPGRHNHTYPTGYENELGEMQHFQTESYFADELFLEQYDIKLLAGRSFSAERASDQQLAMIINETAAHTLGFQEPQKALGHKFEQLGKEGQIIGVIQNFHFSSLREEIQPLALRYAPGFFSFMNVQLAEEDIQTSIKTLQTQWSQLLEDTPFIYSFADEAFQAQYQSEQRFGQLFLTLSTLAIVLSCLGLLSMFILRSNQRIREMGVRKVLGASPLSLCLLLGRDNFRLILLAMFIAIPLANFLVTEWLEGFAYQLDLKWWMFVLPALWVLILAMVTISFQTIKAAQVNPVDCLRYE